MIRKYIIAAMLGCTGSLVHAQTSKHVIIISIDGFRPDFYRNASWPTPNMQHMMQEGAAANGVRGIFPSVTYPSHTTIITGTFPATHGVYYNSPFEPEGITGLWNSETSLIKTPTLWEAVRNAGLKSASVSWPVSVGAPVDYNIPEAFSLDKPGDRRPATSMYATPKGLFEEVQQKATGTMEANDLNINYLKMDENIGRMAAYLIKTYRPALTTIHLVSVDHAEHAEGREGQLVKTAIATADRVIGSILETIALAGMKDSTSVIVTGDHGFVDIHTSISPNVWLVENGMMESKRTPGAKWEAMFQSSGGSTFLLLKDPSNKKAIDKVYKILNNLPASQKKLFRIVDKNELVKIGADPNAVLALNPVQGMSMTTASEGPVMKPAKGGAHGYFPDCFEIMTGFIGYGAGFSKGTVIPVMGLEDIAPVAAKLLGVPFPSAEGIVMPGLLLK